jgi:two-component system, chemotaxis family, chemotaxis protein CheY
MKKILIADDSMFMRKVLTDILGASYTIVYAETGKNAVDQYQKEKPDLVLLDIVMPEGDTEGVSVLRQIKKQDPNAQVVMITAVGQDNIIAECKELGVEDYIVKPFDESKVKKTVEKYIGVKA